MILPLCAEKEKVEGEELQEWLRLVEAPTDLRIFLEGQRQNLLPLKANFWHVLHFHLRGSRLLRELFTKICCSEQKQASLSCCDIFLWWTKWVRTMVFLPMSMMTYPAFGFWNLWSNSMLLSIKVSNYSPTQMLWPKVVCVDRQVMSKLCNRSPRLQGLLVC